MVNVSIVGAGPGNPDLLTYGAYLRLQKAEVVLYDALVSQAILDLIPEQTEKIYVGKRFRKHSHSQEDISSMLAEYGESGKRVVRLKGGDTTIFARLSEEMKTLEEKEIPYEVLGGVTTCSAIAASVKLSLTDRAFGAEFLISTATSYKDFEHCKSITGLLNQGSGTAIYMPLHQGEIIWENLLKAGADPKLPLVLVASGTLPEQRVLQSTLGGASWKKLKEFGGSDPVILLLGKAFGKIVSTD